MGTVHSLASAEFIIGMGHMCFCFFCPGGFWGEGLFFFEGDGGGQAPSGPGVVAGGLRYFFSG